MVSAAVQGQLWGAGRDDCAEVAETLVRLSCGKFGIASRFELSLAPVSATLGGLRNHEIRPA